METSPLLYFATISRDDLKSEKDRPSEPDSLWFKNT